MLTNPTAGRRLSGRLMVLATVAVVLPLTATRAINYVDVPQATNTETPTAAEAPAALFVPAVQSVSAANPVAVPAPAPGAQLAPTPPVASVAPVPPVPPTPPAVVHYGRKGMIMINGREKEWKDLTPAEKREIRRSFAEARAELARNRVDREEIQRDIRETMEDMKIDHEEMKRDLMEAQREIAHAMREVDRNAVHIRRSGQDPEKIKASIRASMRDIEKIDVEAIHRQALASIDHGQIDRSIAEAEKSIAKAQAEIERLEEEFQDD